MADFGPLVAVQRYDQVPVMSPSGAGVLLHERKRPVLDFVQYFTTANVFKRMWAHRHNYLLKSVKVNMKEGERFDDVKNAEIPAAFLSARPN